MIYLPAPNIIYYYTYFFYSFLYVGIRLNDQKLIVNPDFVGCFILHWDGCGTGLMTSELPAAATGGLELLFNQTAIDNYQLLYYQSAEKDTAVFPVTTAYILHFENLFDIRWKSDQLHQVSFLTIVSPI